MFHVDRNTVTRTHGPASGRPARSNPAPITHSVPWRRPTWARTGPSFLARSDLSLSRKRPPGESPMSTFDLSAHGITVEDIRRNLAPSMLYEEAIRNETGTTISDSGALIAYSGEKTGRSPKDKRVVQQPSTENGRLVGSGQFSARRTDVQHQSGAGDRLSQYASRCSTAWTASPAGIRATASRCA